MCRHTCAVRLVSPGNQYSSAGRLEVHHDGAWGTVCDDNFDDWDAKVVCREHRFEGLGTAVTARSFGWGTGPIWLDELWCRGTERNLKECKFGAIGWGKNDCPHTEDVAVICNPPGVAAAATCVWRRACMLLTMRKCLACAPLPYVHYITCLAEHARAWARSASCPASLALPALLIVAASRGADPHLAARPACWGVAPTTHTRCSLPGMLAVRLVAGNNVSATAGRLEVFREWEYGTVCSNGFTDVDARVACRQMGLGKWGAAVPGGILGKGTGKIWMDQVACNGSEAFFEACPHSGWGVHNCTHAQDVGVFCGPTGAHT